MARDMLRTFKIGRGRYVRHTEIEACIARLERSPVSLKDVERAQRMRS